MSCKPIQQEILSHLAAGKPALPMNLMAHQKSCTECRNYYELQRSLFGAIDQELAAIANSAVPPSLLPAVRARLGERRATRPFQFHGWSLTALAATAVAAVAFALFWHGPAQPNNAVPAVARAVAPQQTPERDTSIVPVAPRHGDTKRRPARELPSPAADKHEEPTPEVIVLAEEHEAFARFIAQVPENPAAAVALTRSMAEGNESTVEIALLTIKPLEVKPLESSQE